MADILPLRALRYDASRIGDLSRVLSPPYDVLSGADEEALRAAHPRNFVRLILPREEAGLDRYRASARLLSDWRADGTLRRDPAPAFYFYEQEYRLRDPAPLRRRGVFSLVRLHDFSEGIVLPPAGSDRGPLRPHFRAVLRSRRNGRSTVRGGGARPRHRLGGRRRRRRSPPVGHGAGGRSLRHPRRARRQMGADRRRPPPL
jgi:hypothetical protein